MKRLAILGASGHGKVAAEIASMRGWDVIDFFDECWPLAKKNGVWNIVGNEELLIKNISNYDGFFVAVGNNSIRMEKHLLLKSFSNIFINLIARSAVVSSNVTLGKGILIAEGVCVNIDTQIGDGVIVNTGATVDHDCKLDDFVHLCPGVNLAGNVTIGARTMVGIGSKVIQCISIGETVVVGAGSVVIKDISDKQTVVGAPAMTIKREQIF